MDSERLLISKIAQTGRGLDKMMYEGVAPHHFKDEMGRAIWEFMVAHHMKYGRAPSLPVIQEKFPDYGMELTTDDLDYLKDRFFTDLERAEFIESVRELARVQTDPQYAGRLGELMLEKARELTTMLPGSSVSRFSDVDKRIQAYDLRKAQGGPFGIRFGIPTIDAKTLGIQGHEYITVAGWQGTGKSTLCQWLLYNAYVEGKTALYISLEMGAEALFRKWDVMAAQISRYHDLKSLELSDQDRARWEALAKGVKDRKNDILVLDDVRECTVEKVYAEIGKHRPDIVVIDYITLMDLGKDMNRAALWEKIGHTTHQLKRVAITANCPIIGVAQTNRDSEKAGARLSNIGGSYAIGADSDIVLGLAQDADQKAQGQMILRLEKNRDGETGEAALYWNMKRMEFAEWNERLHMLRQGASYREESDIGNVERAGEAILASRREAA